MKPRNERHTLNVSACLLLTCFPSVIEVQPYLDRVSVNGWRSLGLSGSDIAKVSMACVPVPQGETLASHEARSVL